jgi:TP901 family phage tail tape measure protein
MSLEEAGIKLVTENEDGFKRSMQSAQSAVDNFTGDLSGPQMQRVSGFQAALTGAFTGITMAAIDMAVQATRAVAGFVTDSVGAASDFETGMSVLQAASGATEEEMKALRETSIALGNDITLPATSAQGAAEVMTELVKAGFSVADSQNAAKGALQLATAAQVDEATAAGIVASALNAFHLEGSQAVAVADMLAAGANATQGSITDMSDGFKQAGFIFNASNQDANDLITSLTLLTKEGLTGSDAGTALKNAMMKLNAPTKEGAAAMEALGIDVFDATGKMKPLPDIIGIFNKSMAGMTDEQKNATLATILQSDGMKAFLPLMNAGEEGFRAMAATVNENGAAAKMAGAQTEGFKGAQAALANTLDTLQLIIGTALLPILTDLLNNYILPGAQMVMSLVQSFIDAGASGADMGTQLAGIIPGFDGIMAAVATMQAIFVSAMPAVTAVIEGLKAVIFAVFGEIQKFMAAHGDEIMAVMQAAWELIQLAIQTAIMYYEKVVAPALQKIAKFISDHSEEIQAVFTTVWNIIKGVITTAIQLITGILKAAMQLMQGDTEGALNTLKTTFETIWNKIKGAVEGIVNNLAQGLRTKFEEIKGSITGAITSAYNAVVTQVAQWVKLGESIITGLIDGIKSQAQNLLNQISGVITNAIKAAINIFPEFLRGPLLAFFGISANSASSNFKGAGAGGAGGGFTTYGNTYNLNVTTTASAGVVMDSFAIMQAYG